MELSYRFTFDAAHHFPNYAAGHLYHGLHGHSFQAEVSVRGATDPTTGFVVDFAKLETACAKVREQLDHKYLNDVPGLELPSLENLCLWIWGKLVPEFPQLVRVTVRRDSYHQSCTYTGA